MGTCVQTGHQGRLSNKFNKLKKELKTISDNQFLSKIKALNNRERKLKLTVLFHLKEIDKRELYLALGYHSLFEFCTRHLGYTRSSACRRIQAARCVGDFPEAADMLLAGELNLSVISLISGILTKENIKDILALVAGKSYPDAEIAIVMYKPIERKTRDKIKPVSVLEKRSTPDVGSDPGVNNYSKSFNVETDSGEKSAEITPDVETDPAGTAETDKRDEEAEVKQKFKLEFMVNPEFLKKVEEIRSELSRKYPSGVSFEILFNIVMDEYLERRSHERRIKRREKEKSSKKRKRKSLSEDNRKREKKKSGRRTRDIPAAVRDEVYRRDKGRCSFVGRNGTRCNSTWNLEIDHIVPFARGGDSSPCNLRLLCGRHNRLEAERAYGKDFMRKYIRKE